MQRVPVFFCTGYCGAVFRTWRISACACDWSGNAVKNDGLDGPEHLRAFGDGAGAAVLSVSEEDGILSMVQGSDGFRGDVLNCMARKVNNPYKKMTRHFPIFP